MHISVSLLSMVLNWKCFEYWQSSSHGHSFSELVKLWQWWMDGYLCQFPKLWQCCCGQFRHWAACPHLWPQRHFKSSPPLISKKSQKRCVWALMYYVSTLNRIYTWYLNLLSFWVSGTMCYIKIKKMKVMLCSY